MPLTAASVFDGDWNTVYTWLCDRRDKDAATLNYVIWSKEHRCYVSAKDFMNTPAVPLEVPKEKINHPSHYNMGKIEVIDFIEDQDLNFNRGNAVKYIARAGVKDIATELDDLKKAVWYMNREIQRLER